MTGSKRALFAAVAFTAALGAALLAAEAAVRLFVPESFWRPREASADWRLDPRLGWVHTPDLDITTATEFGWRVRFRTNRDGVVPATATRERTPGRARLMMFGDSTVVGRLVPQDRTVSADLERLLDAHARGAEVINAGVQGYSTDQVMLRMEELLPLYRPDLVFYCVCENDFGGNVSDEANNHAKPRFMLAGDGTLREIAPPIQGTIDSPHRGPAVWIQHSALYRLARMHYILLRARTGGWKERNLIGMGHEIYYKKDALDRYDWRLFGALLGRMKSSAEGAGAKLVVYAHPALEEVWDPYVAETIERAGIDAAQYDRHALEKRLIAACTASGIEFCPLIDGFLARKAQGPFHLLPRDPHCNPAGYAATAEILSEFLEGHRLLPGEPTAGGR